MEFVIKTTNPVENLSEIADKVRATGMFYFIDHDLKLDKPQSELVVNRDMAASLRLTQQGVGAALGRALGGGYVNYFSIAGRAYKVVPQVRQPDRLAPSSYTADYSGQSRQLVQESGGFVGTLPFAIFIVFLALAVRPCGRAKNGKHAQALR